MVRCDGGDVRLGLGAGVIKKLAQQAEQTNKFVKNPVVTEYINRADLDVQPTRK